MLLAVMLVFCGCFFTTWKTEKNVNAITVTAMADNKQQISAPEAGSFKNEGMYLCRPDEPNENNVYYASVDMSSLISTKTEFHPKISALVRVNDKWLDADSHYFYVSDEDATQYSVFWYLRETAPAAVYGVRCSYKETSNGITEDVEKIFLVLYTDEWTYINVADDNNERRVTQFLGGEDKTLYLNVTFNDGAARPNLKNNAVNDNGIAHNAILDDRDIVSLDTMDITVKTLSGDVYAKENLDYEIDSNNQNRIALRFLKKLGNDTYIIQFSSNANQRIYGQYVIDNTDRKQGVNLSQIWALLMIVGGVLALGASCAFLIPFGIVKVNESRVNKENERVDRMKNPEKYAESDKKSLKGVMSKIIYNLKTPAYKRKKDKEEAEEKPVEEKVYTNRFTEMLRERQEQREFMRENNVTSEQLEQMKEAEEEAKREEAASFASLRDDDDEDDEIATFHAAEDEVSTLETGAYTKDGTTFAKLDSMQDEEPENGNDDGGK